MRYFINIADSYKDESDSIDSKRIETNLGLEIGDFSEENDQLATEFVIADPNTRQAVKHYTHASSINDELIRVDGDFNKLPEDFRTEYNELISLKGVPLHEEHHTYCGTGTFDPMEVTIDGIFNTPAFLSTSLSVRVAVKATNYRRDEVEAQDDHVLHFVLPGGFAGGFYVAPYSNDPEELEYLLFPKERFRHLNSQAMTLEDGIKRHIHTFSPI